MKNKALFLDRDGVINVDKKYVYKIKDFEFCEGIFELCEFFSQKGFLIFVITNQSGIARGYYTEEDFEILSAFVLDEFAKRKTKISKIYHCPHLEGCECRKPKPGMLLKAKDEFDINMQNSIFIGDNLSDMEAGLSAGVKTLVLIDPSLKQSKDFKSFANLTELLNFFKSKEKL
ncbi:MAG: HAD family hydrolase [Campylobacter sp.]|nr:HAD family hydrolase [Campylobacter sp.]